MSKRFLEYFAVTIRNRNTRLAYLHAARQFFTFCGFCRLLSSCADDSPGITDNAKARHMSGGSPDGAAAGSVVHGTLLGPDSRAGPSHSLAAPETPAPEAAR